MYIPLIFLECSTIFYTQCLLIYIRWCLVFSFYFWCLYFTWEPERTCESILPFLELCLPLLKTVHQDLHWFVGSICNSLVRCYLEASPDFRAHAHKLQMQMMRLNSLAVAGVNWESLMTVACIRGTEITFSVAFFLIVEVPGGFLFSSSGGKFCCSFRLDGYMKKKKKQQTICKDRGKIISSAEPSKCWQQTPVPLSWDVRVVNSA